MTPVDKARHLIEGFNLSSSDKESALIVVNEIMYIHECNLMGKIKFHRFKNVYEIDIKFDLDDYIITEEMTAFEYWKNVEIEILKL